MNSSIDIAGHRIDYGFAVERKGTTKGWVKQVHFADILDGKDTPCDPDLRGDMLLLAEGRCIGRGLAKDGLLKNNLPRLMIQQS